MFVLWVEPWLDMSQPCQRYDSIGAVQIFVNLAHHCSAKVNLTLIFQSLSRCNYRYQYDIIVSVLVSVWSSLQESILVWEIFRYR